MSVAFVAVGVGAAGAIYGAEQNKQAARSAATAQKDAAQSANATELYMYDQNREDQKPWLDSGKKALGELNGQMGDLTKSFSMSDFQQDPGYDFRMQQGVQALDRSAAARGGLNNGGTLKALTQYGQDMGSQEYQNAYNRFNNDRDSKYNKLAGMAGVGQSAANQLGAAGQNYANAYGNNTMGAANAQGAAGIAAANANSQMVSGMANTGANTWMAYQMMNK